MQHAACPVGDFPQMDQPARKVGYLGIGDGLLAAADAVEEVVHVLGVARRPVLHARPFLFVLAQIHLEIPAPREDHVALRAIERVAAVEAMEAVGGPAAVLVEEHFALFVVVRDHHVVRKLPLAAESDPAAMRRDANRMRLDAQAPAGEIDIVRPVAADIAVAEGAVPVPIAVVAVGIERAVERRGPDPDVVVDARRHGSVGDRLPVRMQLAIPRLRHLHFAENALLEQFVSLLRHCARTHLRAVLHDAAVFARRFDQDPAFAKDVAGRFLDVDILAGLHRADRDGRVPVMGRRHDDGLDSLVFKDLAEILDQRRRVPAGAVDGLPRSLRVGLVDVAERHDADVVAGQEPLDMSVSHASDADDGNPELVVGRSGVGPDGETGQGDADRFAASDTIHGTSLPTR